MKPSNYGFPDGIKAWRLLWEFKLFGKLYRLWVLEEPNVRERESLCGSLSSQAT